MNKTERKLTIQATPAPGCSACQYGTRHTAADWKNHPAAGDGHSQEHGKPLKKEESAS